MGALLSKIRTRLPVLQVALDLTSADDAARVAQELAGLSDKLVFEVGTPLIKAAGASAIRRLREVVGDAPVVADTKSVDAVRVEAELVARSGADAFTVMGFVDDEVVRGALSASLELGIDAVFDTMYMEPLTAVERLHRLGARIVGLHVGVDVQRRLGLTAEQLVDYVRRVKREYGDLIVAVAGGINERSAPKLVDAGADIIVVGSAIVRSPQPRRAAEAILKAFGTR